MKSFFFVFSSLCILCFCHVAATGQPTAQPISLRAEHLTNPLGIDEALPRLTWELADTRQGARQTAYEIVVSTDSLSVVRGSGTEWSTGKVASDAQLVRYAGQALQPFTRYFWSVRVWDKDGEASNRAPVAHFETGTMHTGNWKGAWISDSRDIEEKGAPYFRKEFGTGKKIKAARVYIAAAGLFELSVNGEKVGDHVLDPMYTRFDRRILYVTHDVTNKLKNGNNAIGVLLGNGWYNHQSTAVWYFHEAPWRGRPTFMLDLRITYEDGSVETISSSKDWKTSLSPVTFNSIYTAEHYDARLQQPGWNLPGFDDLQWKNVIFRTAPTTNIVAQVLQPVRHVAEVPAKTVNKINDTLYVFDLGRNIAGVSRITVKGGSGTVLRLKHTEMLDENGRGDMSNIDVHYRPTDDTDPFQTDIFILSGNGEESFMPRFNYKGFQYVEVSSSEPITLTKESLIGLFMHSDVPTAGMVGSSNTTLNKTWAAANNSYLSNLFGYPTDCPQREKNGWTGDAHIASETGLYSFDGITVYEKWMADHRDEQQPNGVLPSIIPTDGWGYEWGNGPDWTSTIAIIPWNLYLFYGDTTQLAANYENIKRYVDHIDYLYPSGLTTWGLGDWVPVKSKTPVELTSTAYYFVDADILAKTAGLLSKTDDERKYSRLAQKIKTAFNDKYLNTGTGIYGSGLQTELSVPLQWGLVPDNMRAKVAANLAARVKADGNHIDVGLLGTKAILNALSENGYADLAYQVASQETYPSWGWWIANGATTFYENWDPNAQSDLSMNHIMFGEIGAWYYKALGGIRPDPEDPGFKNILLEPHFVAGLEHFESEHESPYGTIRSAWAKKGKTIRYTATVPPNSTAYLTLDIPAGKKLYRSGQLAEQNPGLFEDLLEAGTYTFELK